jgi:branched-chain amino acid transport system ATP-binding protein
MRYLISKPILVMLYESSLGLSPKLIGPVFDKIKEVNKENAVTIMIVEQDVGEVLETCDRVCFFFQNT